MALLVSLIALLAQPVWAGTQLDLRGTTPAFTAYGSADRDRLGLSMDIGDLNGDGLEDVASGAPLDEKPADTELNRGALHVYFGAPGFSGVRDSSQAGSPDLIVYGRKGCAGTISSCSNATSDVLGKGVVIADLNNDGIEDLVVSSVRADAPDGTPRRAGQVYVFYGRASWPSVIDLSVDPALADVTIVGDTADGDFGIHLAAADFDGDGWRDLVIGQAAVLAASSAGGLHVIYGGPSLPASIDLSAPPGSVRIFSVDGEAPGDKLGHAVATGDLNGDGIADVIGGAPRGEGVCGTEVGGGKTVVFFGSSSEPLEGAWDLSVTPAPYTVYSGEDGDQMGRRVDAGDVNGDGQADLILPSRCTDAVGATRTNAGRATILFGPLAPGTRSLASAPGDVIIEGIDAGDYLGVGVTTGDVNGDGVGDLMLGADEADGARNRKRESGEAYIFFGPLAAGTRDLRTTPADITLLGVDQGDRLGRFMAAGDLDGDGVADFGVTAYLSRGAGNTLAQVGEFYVLTGLDADDLAVPVVTMTSPQVDGLVTSTSVRASWSGSDDVGIVRYDLYERIGTAGSQALVRSSLDTSYTRTGTRGSTYCYQVFAYDASGKEGTAPERCAAVPLDDRDAPIAYSGEIAQISASGAFMSTLTLLNGSGQQAEMSFTGRKVGVLAQRTPSSGMVDVWIDGEFKAQVDLYASYIQNRRYVYQRALSDGTHTLALVWSGVANPSSAGTEVRLDGIAAVGP